MRRIWMLGVGLAIAACGRGTQPDADGPATPVTGAKAPDAATLAPAEEPAGFSVVDASTPLRRRPSTDSEPVELNGGDLGPVAVEVVEVQGQWIHLRNIAAEDADQHCAAAWSNLSDYRLDFWALRTDLSPVLRRPVFRRFEDDTSVMLGPGVPIADEGLEAGRDGTLAHRLVDLDGTQLHVPLEAAAIGRFYQLGPRFSAAAQSMIFSDTALTYDGGKPLLPVGLAGDGPRTAVYKSKPVDGGQLLTLGHPCAELEVLAPEDAARGSALGSLRPRRGGVIQLEVDEAPRGLVREFKIPSQAKVLWPDAEPAGVVVREIRFTDEPRVDSSLRCWRVSAQELCFEADAVQRIEPEIAGILGALGSGGSAEFGGGIAELRGGGLGGALGGPEIGSGGLGLGGLGRIGEPPEPEPPEPEPPEPEPPEPEPPEPEPPEPEPPEPEPPEPQTPEPQTPEPQTPEPQTPEPEPPEPETPEPSSEDSDSGGAVPPPGSGGTPKVRSGKATTIGALEKDVVRRVVRGHVTQVKRCYTKELKSDPALEGKVVVSWIIEPSGGVKSVKLKSNTTGSAPLGKCITSAVGRWKFPEPRGGGLVMVTYPFTFATT